MGGTAYAWCKERLAGKLDVLFVDEAGQMSLANALALAGAARSLVLLGDPAQLEQPQKGVHPPGADVSALSHVLGGAATMPPELGLFLPVTRRLHPALCDFTSTIFYDGRLRALPGLERQRLESDGRLSGSGLRHVPVAHQGNTSSSPEEVDEVVGLVAELLGVGGSGGDRAEPARFVDRDGQSRPLSAADVLDVTPYNNQVASLRVRLPEGVAVGTVDRFQGREAPVVLYSMATSRGEDAPRGLEFLYNLNRLNVAISRAQALAIVVCSPELSRVACRTPRQLRLVSALCAFLERAEIVAPMPR
jgi:uncharacterized protein